MRFEEVLPLMREGKKARHARMRADEFWTCGTAAMKAYGVAEFPVIMKVFTNPFEDDRNSYSWGIERWAIMVDDWEIVE